VYIVPVSAVASFKEGDVVIELGGAGEDPVAVLCAVLILLYLLFGGVGIGFTFVLVAEESG
jgi:hypothetical protein